MSLKKQNLPRGNSKGNQKTFVKNRAGFHDVQGDLRENAFIRNLTEESATPVQKKKLRALTLVPTPGVPELGEARSLRERATRVLWTGIATLAISGKWAYDQVTASKK